MNNTLKKAKIDLIVVMIVKMQKRNNIVLTILKKYIADVLLAQRAIWKHVFNVKSIKKDEKLDWSRQVKYLSSSRVKMFDSSIQVESESWNQVLTRNSRLDSSRHEDR